MPMYCDPEMLSRWFDDRSRPDETGSNIARHEHFTPASGRSAGRTLLRREPQGSGNREWCQRYGPEQHGALDEKPRSPSKAQQDTIYR